MTITTAVAFAAVGVGHAPGRLRHSDDARAGLAKELKEYLPGAKAPNLHHSAMLLWASLKVDGLITDEERKATVKELLALQRPDGGWSLPTLGDWTRDDGRRTTPRPATATGPVSSSTSCASRACRRITRVKGAPRGSRRTSANPGGGSPAR